MRTSPPALFPVFRSTMQGRLLAALLLDPEREHTLTELADRVGAPLSTVHGEVERLINGGILAERTQGRNRLVRANLGSPVVQPLTELVALTFGPEEVVADEFAGLKHVDQVIIFGSWAARRHGEVGPPPRDVDVLVVGKPVRADLYDSADRAERRIGLPVNTVVASRERFSQRADPLMKQIAVSPSVTVISRAGAR